jgi:hypothetical protein
MKIGKNQQVRKGRGVKVEVIDQFSILYLMLS